MVQFDMFFLTPLDEQAKSLTLFVVDIHGHKLTKSPQTTFPFTGEARMSTLNIISPSYKQEVNITSVLNEVWY